MVVALVTAAGAQTGPGYALNERGNEAAARRDYSAAEQFYSQALEAWRSEGASSDPYVATTLINLGELYCSEGKWRQALTVAQQALELNRRSLGLKHIRTVTNLNVLGNIYLFLGELDKAEAAYDEALPVEEKLYPHDLQLAQTLAGLSSVRMRMGRAEENLPLAERALSLAIETQGEQNMAVAGMYSNLAQLHVQAGRPERAIPLFRKARAITEQILGADNPALAALLCSEGSALMNDGQLGLAGDKMEQAIRLLAQCADCKYELAVAECNLGVLRFRQHQYDQADRLLTAGLAMEEQFAPRASADQVATLRVLAKLREKQKRYTDAVTLKSRANAMAAFREPASVN